MHGRATLYNCEAFTCIGGSGNQCEKKKDRKLKDLRRFSPLFVGKFESTQATTMSKIVLVGACGALVWLLRRYFGGGVCRTCLSLKGKTAIITGGNTGIGKATALALARRGAKVILACRSIARGDRAAKEIRQEVRDAEIGVRFLDLSSLGSVRRFVDDFLRSKNRLHILVNNAGMYGCPHWKSEDGYEMHFAVNHLGHFLLTNLLLDTLSRCGPSRVVVVSSSLHKYAKINFDDLHGDKCYVPGAAYSQSKLANILFARELSKRLPPGTWPVLGIL